MNDPELTAALDDAVAVFARVPTDDAALALPVPSCPDWTLAQLIEHQGYVHRWATLVLTTKPEARPKRDRTPLPPGSDFRAFLLDGAEALRAAVAASDPDEIVWTFTGGRPARWWLRRQVHETTVHALDALDALAAGGREPEPPGPFVVRPEVAADGVDELFEVFVPRVFDAAAFAGTGETLHLHATDTDTDGEWLLRFAPDGIEVTREHAKGDAAARGPAVELLRLMWARPTGADLTVFGDDTVLDRYRAACRI